MNTMIELVTELKKLPESADIDILISEAESGHYHDYRSPHVCCKMYAVSQFRKVGTPELNKLANDIINGDYDEEFTKEDEIFCHAEFDNDPDMSEKDRDFYKSMMKAR